MIRHVVASVTRLDLRKAHAAREAARIAELHGARLTWVYPLASLGILPAGAQGMAQREHARMAAARLEKLASSLRSPGLRPEVVLSVGKRHVVVAEEARARDADLVVVGAHRGWSWWSRFENVWARRLADAMYPCPVLGVHGGDALPVQRGVRVLIPARTADTALRIVSHASAVLGTAAAETRIRLVRLANGRAEDENPGAERDLARALEDLQDAGADVKVTVRTGEPVRVVERESRDFGPHVVAVHTLTWSDHHFLRGSSLGRLLTSARCAVLAV